MENYSQITRAIEELTAEIRKLRRAVEHIGKPETCRYCYWARKDLGGAIFCNRDSSRRSESSTCIGFERR